MELLEGHLYLIKEKCGHPHYKQLRGKKVEFIHSPVPAIAVVNYRRQQWHVYVRDVVMIDTPTTNEEATCLLKGEESLWN